MKYRLKPGDLFIGLTINAGLDPQGVNLWYTDTDTYYTTVRHPLAFLIILRIGERLNVSRTALSSELYMTHRGILRVWLDNKINTVGKHVHVLDCEDA